MNKNISISLFRISGDRKYLDMIFSCPYGYHFTSLELEARFVGDDGKFQSSFFDLSMALFDLESEPQLRYVVRVPLEQLGITVPAIYIATFKIIEDGSDVEDIQVTSDIISVEEYIPDTEGYSDLIQSNGLENVISYGTKIGTLYLNCGTITIRSGKTIFSIGLIPNNGFLHFTAYNEFATLNVIVKHNNNTINPEGLNYNIYNLNSGDTLSFETYAGREFSFKMTKEECTPGYITYEHSESNSSDPITDTAICSDVVEAYRCMMDDLFMHEKDDSCTDMISDEVIRKYLLVYGHTAAMAARDLDTAQEYFRLIGNCFDKCGPKGRGKGSCCPTCGSKFKPIPINPCNCGRR